MIASREMAARPSGVWESIKKEGAVVVTKNGQPEGFFVATDAETWLEDVQDILFLRARRATRHLRMAAARDKRDAMSDEDIEAEIAAYRAERR